MIKGPEAHGGAWSSPGAYSRQLYRCPVCDDLFTVSVAVGYQPPTAPQSCPAAYPHWTAPKG